MSFNPQNVKGFDFSPHKIRKLCRQRIRHGFCDYDVWDIIAILKNPVNNHQQ